MGKGNTVLIDMDNTLAQFDLEFGKRWAAAYPLGSPETIANRKHFELEKNFPDDPAGREAAVAIMSAPGLFIMFEPAVGCVEAVKEMTAAGLSVFFCTAPLPMQYESCVAEKYSWVRKHFGDEYLPKIIITRDKTLIKGDVLIDDKPKITGVVADPEWTHLVYPQSYNKGVVDADGKPMPRFSEWSEWRTTLADFVEF
jgi:5'-nucleotidase